MVPLGSNDKTRVIGQDELEQIRKQKIKEEQEKPVQLSLFDM